jgi:hypothetical protein
MNKIILLLASVFMLASCSEKKTEIKPKPDYLKSVKYVDWEIGNPDNIKPVLDFYNFWDKQDIQNITSLFGDTVRLRIPDERAEIMAPHDKIYEGLKANRAMYTSSTNDVLSVVSLHDRERNEDWVMATVYSKWIEDGGRRDSVLFSDNWRLKDGKINFLMSFDKKPTSSFLKANDTTTVTK